MRASLVVNLCAAVVALLVSPFVATTSTAQEDPSCRPEVARLDKYAYLRALSLDLRGVVPTVEEYEALDGMDDVPAALVDEWMTSDGYASRFVRRHRTQLWPNISNVRLVHQDRRLISRSGLWWRSSQSGIFRRERVGCLDEPARFDADGNILFTEMPDGSRREGYVMVNPYWAPETELKVCAIDAQEHAFSIVTGNDCSTRGANRDIGCGCGPSLNWCDTTNVHNAITASFKTDLERRLFEHAKSGEAYTELFRSRRAFVNGPQVHFWKYLAPLYRSVPLVPSPLNMTTLPGIAYTDADTWEELELPESHAGILTSPVFLLRFQTNRARASQFYDAFLCRPFQPPPGGIPLGNELEALRPDLQERAGCKYCHAILEPGAAHWARWTQQGGGFLDPTQYPAFDAACADCGRGLEACSTACSLHYTTRAVGAEEEEYLGMLRGFQFLRPEHEGFVEAGPWRLVQEGLSDGSLSECSVRRAAQWMLDRDLSANEGEWNDDLVDTFVGDEFSYGAVVREIVLSATYRRVR